MGDAPHLIYATSVGHPEVVPSKIVEVPRRVHRCAEKIDGFCLAPEVLPGGGKSPQQPMRIDVDGMVRVEFPHAGPDPA